MGDPEVRDLETRRHGGRAQQRGIRAFGEVSATNNRRCAHGAQRSTLHANNFKRQDVFARINSDATDQAVTDDPGSIHSRHQSLPEATMLEHLSQRLGARAVHLMLRRWRVVGEIGEAPGAAAAIVSP